MFKLLKQFNFLQDVYTLIGLTLKVAPFVLTYLLNLFFSFNSSKKKLSKYCPVRKLFLVGCDSLLGCKISEPSLEQVSQSQEFEIWTQIWVKMIVHYSALLVHF